MNDSQLIGAVHSVMYHQCQKRGYAAPVDVLMDIGVLPKKQYEAWRNGKVGYLESVCTVNLRKLSFINYSKTRDVYVAYGEYRQAREEIKKLSIIKHNIDKLLGRQEPKKAEQEKTQEQR